MKKIHNFFFLSLDLFLNEYSSIRRSQRSRDMISICWQRSFFWISKKFNAKKTQLDFGIVLPKKKETRYVSKFQPSCRIVNFCLDSPSLFSLLWLSSLLLLRNLVVKCYFECYICDFCILLYMLWIKVSFEIFNILHIYI